MELSLGTAVVASRHEYKIVEGPGPQMEFPEIPILFYPRGRRYQQFRPREAFNSGCFRKADIHTNQHTEFAVGRGAEFEIFPILEKELLFCEKVHLRVA